MKIVILGEEKGLFKNLVNWINAHPAGHQAVLWSKFYPDGNKETATQCPITDPDIIMCLSNYVTYEDLPYMGITTQPKRVYYNLGNRRVSNILRDWRMSVFNDAYASYNPLHKDYQISELPNRFANLKCLPLPFDYRDYTTNDYSGATLRVCQSLSQIAMYGAYSKQTMLIARACKLADVPFDLIFDLPTNEYIARKAQSPVVFDNLQGMFGVTALQSMAMGQAVICHVEQPILDKYAEILGSPPPVLSATTAAELNQLISDMKSGVVDWKAKCAVARAYMQNNYNPVKITQAYIQFFNSLLG